MAQNLKRTIKTQSMKSLILGFSLLTLSASQCDSLDQISSTKEVEAFIVATNKTYEQDSKRISIKSTEQLSEELNCDGIFKSWDIKSWEKADLNNDGRTDLLVLAEWYGPHPLIILDQGNQNYEYFNLNNNTFEYCELYKPFEYKGLTLIKAHVPINSRESLIPGEEKFRIDTLTFYDNYLVKYNPNPSENNISSIQLRTSACFGLCPEFELELLPDDMVKFNGIANTPTKGKSSFKAAEGSFNKISGLLNYMQVKTLNSRYDVNWTDDQTAYLTVNFADGSRKNIQDYGLQGTSGLKAVYQELFKIMKSVNAM